MADNNEILNKLHDTLLEILLVFDKFCTENQLDYFLDSGTALGAKRHNGFIPWDDDVDVALLREDYDRFLELAQTGLPSGYSLHTCENTPGYAGTFAKIYKDGTIFETQETRDAGCPQCIFIDVFPYDRMSADEAEAKRQLQQTSFWQKIAYLHFSPNVNIPLKGALKTVAQAGCRFAHIIASRAWSMSDVKQKYETALKCYVPSNFYICYADPKKPLPREALVPTTPISFEGHELPGPRDVSHYLTALYGENWSQLPPEEDRHTHLPLNIQF